MDDAPRVLFSVDLYQIQYDKAQTMLERALAIRMGSLGVDHPSTINSRAWIAELYQKQGLLKKASPLLQEIVFARERVQGHEHLDVALALRKWGAVLSTQVRLDILSQKLLRGSETGHCSCFIT